MVSTEGLVVGELYDRPELAARWGYEDWHALGRGVVTPAKQKVIVLFVTRDKQESLVQYKDHFEGELLFMEGEESGAANERLMNASASGDRVLLFYRDRHHCKFTFYGDVRLERVERREGKPIFVWSTRLFEAKAESSLRTDEAAFIGYTPRLEGGARPYEGTRYERDANNRAEALRLHGTVCRACGFNFDEVYGAELARGYIQVHHVRSIASGERSVNPETDLVPLCPNCHAMVHRRPGQIVPIRELRELIRRRGKGDE